MEEEAMALAKGVEGRLKVRGTATAEGSTRVRERARVEEAKMTVAAAKAREITLLPGASSLILVESDGPVRWLDSQNNPRSARTTCISPSTIWHGSGTIQHRAHLLWVVASRQVEFVLVRRCFAPSRQSQLPPAAAVASISRGAATKRKPFRLYDASAAEQ